MVLLSLVYCYSRFSIYPRHGHPLRRRVHPFHDSFQFVDGLFDVLVDDGYVEQMLVGTLQQLRLVGQFFQAPVELQNVHTTIMFKLCSASRTAFACVRSVSTNVHNANRIRIGIHRAHETGEYTGGVRSSVSSVFPTAISIIL